MGKYTSAALDQELYDLKVLGYCGPMITNVVQKSGHSVCNGLEINKPFDRSARDRVLGELLEHLNDCRRNNHYVSPLGVGQILRTTGIKLDSQALGVIKQGFRLYECNNAEDIPAGTLAPDDAVHRRPGESKFVAAKTIKRWDYLNWTAV